MSKEDITRLINALLTEIKTSELDTTTVTQLKDFEKALTPYLSDTIENKSDNTILDKANELEIAFAQKHPRAEGIVREIIDSLSRMGI